MLSGTELPSEVEVKTEPIIRIDCKQGLIRAVRFNADGQYAMTCGSDRTIKLWRPNKLMQLKCYKGHSSDVVDCQANKDSSQFISCSSDKSIIAWDVETGKILRRFRNMAPFNTVCYGTGSSTAFASSVDGTVRIYDLRVSNAWEPIQTLSDATDSVTCCKVHGDVIITTSLDKSLRTYDVRKGSLFVDTMHMALNNLAIGQTAGTVLLTCLRGTTLLVDKDGKILNEYKGNQNKLFKLENSFLLNESCVAVGSEDNCAYMWNLMDEKPKLAFKHLDVSHTIVHSLSSDTLDHLLTACGGYILMWSI